MEKVALITGAGSGNGSGVARVLAENGYDVAIHSGSNKERAMALAEDIHKATGRKAEAFYADFTKPGAAGELFNQFNASFQRLDLLVCNAGVSTINGKIMGVTEEMYDTVDSTNFKSMYFCVQEAARIMVEKKIHGSMVLISSNQHVLIGGGNSLYSLSKESIVHFTKHAALELARYGIRVNCVAPGWINTGEKRMEGWYERSVGEIPLHRWVQPGEIAQWAMFLTTQAAASLTGATIDLDGGVRLMTGRPEVYCSPE